MWHSPKWPRTENGRAQAFKTGMSQRKSVKKNKDFHDCIDESRADAPLLDLICCKDQILASLPAPLVDLQLERHTQKQIGPVVTNLAQTVQYT